MTPQLLAEHTSTVERLGYGASSDLTSEQAAQSATFALLACRDAATGDETWQEQQAKEVSNGAPVEETRQYFGYLQTTFCPQVH